MNSTSTTAFPLDVRSAIGRDAISTLMPVPATYTTKEPRAELYMEDIFKTGRSRWLLGDAITAADFDETDTASVRKHIADICQDWRHSLATTGYRAPLSYCVPDLYRDRIACGGRFDRWYHPKAHLNLGPRSTPLRRLADIEFRINERPYQVDLLDTIEQIRDDLADATQWITALTQGDPTEPNIAVESRCWLDFEYAGRNTICGEIANLLWYLLALGGWLVPTYQPHTHQRTLRHPRKHSAPTIDVSNQRHGIHVALRWTSGKGRAAAIKELVKQVSTGPLYEACTATGHSPNILDALRPFLLARILGVIPLTTMQPKHRLGCLAALAIITNPQTTLDSLLTDLQHEVRQ